MVTLRVKVQYEVELSVPDMPDDILQQMVQQGSETINLDDDTKLAEYIVDNIQQEDSYSQTAVLEELTDGENIWI